MLVMVKAKLDEGCQYGLAVRRSLDWGVDENLATWLAIHMLKNVS